MPLYEHCGGPDSGMGPTGEDLFKVEPEHAELYARPGAALCLAELDNNGQFVDGSHHVIVAASVDDGPTMYASKLSDGGPVRLHGLEAAVDCYGVNYAFAVEFPLSPSQLATSADRR